MPEASRRLRGHHLGLVLGVGVAAMVLAAAVALLMNGGTILSRGSTLGPTGSSVVGVASSPSAAPGPLTIVALGDSVPSAASCGCTGYVELLGSRLAELTGRADVVHNDATGGWTSSDAVSDLNETATRSDLARADLVLVEVGANDFDPDTIDDPTCLPAGSSPCWSSTLRLLRSNLVQIIGTVRRLDTNAAVRIALIGYWNVTVDGVVGRQLGPDFVNGSDALTRTVNTTVERVAAESGATYVDAYTPLKGQNGELDPTNQLLDDGDHPNQAGHQVLMQAVLSTLVAQDAVSSWENR